jgi:hypothetical protein
MARIFLLLSLMAISAIFSTGGMAGPEDAATEGPCCSSGGGTGGGGGGGN